MTIPFPNKNTPQKEFRGMHPNVLYHNKAEEFVLHLRNELCI